MNKITIDNYEAYLLDLSEGNLSGEMQVELELFLIQHPELKTDLSDLLLFTVNTDKVVFKGKNSLKRSEGDLVTEEQFIAYIEGQLPLNERVQLEKSCSANPSLANELSLYKKSVATADVSIVYEPKHELKRKPKIIWFNFSATQFAAAASVLLLIGLFILWPKSGKNNVDNANSLADNKTQNHKTPLKNSMQKPNAVKEAASTNTIPGNKHISTGNNFRNEQPVAVNSTQSNTTAIQNNETPAPDIKHEQPAIATASPVTAPLKEEKNTTLLASNSKTTIDVISESDDEEAVEETPKKKGIWGLAKRTLKNLNTVGVKSVNGAEEETKDNRTYALTLGNIKITHKGN